MAVEGWEEKSLEDLAYYHNGCAFKPEDWGKAGLPIIRIANINDPDADLDYYDGNDIPENNLINNGDLIFSWSATLTAMRWDRGPAILNQHIFKVVEKPNVHKGYLLQLIKNSIDALAEHSHGSTMKHIKKGVLKVFKVDVPPLQEQKKIAEVLESVDDAIAKTEAVIVQTERVKQGLLQQLLTRGIAHTKFKQSPLGEIPESWEISTLGEFATRITSGSRGWAEYYAETGAAFLRITNLKRNNIHPDLSDLKKVKLPAGSTEGIRTKVKVGDILISITADLGIIGYIKDDKIGEAYVNQHIALVSLEPQKIHSGFAAYFFASPFMQAYIQRLNDAGAKAGLNLNTINKLPLLRPSMDEQKKIFETIEMVNTRYLKAHTDLSALQKTKKGLMSDLLTGRVRVPVSPQTQAEAA